MSEVSRPTGVLAEAEVIRPGRWRATPAARFAAEFAESPVAVASLLLIIFLAVLAILGDWITPQDPYDLLQLDIMNNVLPPGATTFDGEMTFYLGTDDQGRDMLSAIIFGLRMSLGVGAMSTVIALSAAGSMP